MSNNVLSPSYVIGIAIAFEFSRWDLYAKSACSMWLILRLIFPHVYVLAGGTDICYGSDRGNGISDGRSRGNGECGDYRISHVSVRGRCFPGDVLHLTHIHLLWSVSYNSFRHRKRCVDGLNCSAIFHRFATLSAIL